MSITIETQNYPLLRAVSAMMASRTEIRHYLQSVHIQTAKKGGLIYTASNSQYIAVGHDDTATVEGDIPAKGMLLGNDGKMFQKIQGQRSGTMVTMDHSVKITVEQDLPDVGKHEPQEAKVTYNDTEFTLTAGHGTYPDFATGRIFRGFGGMSTLPLDGTSVKAEAFVTINKMAACFKENHITLGGDDDGTLVFRIGCQKLVGLVMPLRTGISVAEWPAWLGRRLVTRKSKN